MTAAAITTTGQLPVAMARTTVATPATTMIVLAAAFRLAVFIPASAYMA
jgi:hypothetical protein